MRHAGSILAAIFIVAINGPFGQPAKPAPAPERLGNGVRILMHPVPGMKQVAVEAFYGVGLVHEPAGMPQAAHLLEHLVCNAATNGYKAGESMELLNQLGLANAETMPDWTHYDYMAPAENLEKLLEIEAQRLGSLVIDEAIIRQEGPRCAQEVDFVEQNPRAGMGKFAFCALAQSWRHGKDVANVRTGLEGYSVEAMGQFWRATYRPENLTLVIVGDFDPAETMKLVEKHLGAIPNREVPGVEAIDWEQAPRRATVTWDSKVQGICLAFPPPKDRTDRVVLSLWGATLQQRLAGDPELQAMVDAIYTPNHMWPVGELPFFVYAAAKPGTDLQKLEAALAERLAALVEAGGGMPPATIGLYARQLAAVRETLSEPRVRQTARFLAQDGRTEEQAMGMVLGQGAINWGVAERFLGEDPAAMVAALEALTAERLSQILSDNLGEERRMVTYLVSKAVGE